MMRPVAPLADYVRAKRSPISADNPFIAMQEQFSKAMVDALNLFRDLRDDLVERSFHSVYGSPLVQAACGISQNDSPPRPRPGLLPSVLAATEEEKRRLKGRIAEGNTLDAAARVLVYIGSAQHRIDKNTFNALRNLLLAHPEVSPAEFKAAVREQWAILAVDERAAIDALPQLVPTDARRAFADFVQATVEATGKLNVEAKRRLGEVLHLVADGSRRSATRSKREEIMDWNRVQGNWKQLEGKIKAKWGLLTGDDLTAINGRREQLEGKLQERYGWAKDKARKEIDEWFTSQGF